MDLDEDGITAASVLLKEFGKKTTGVNFHGEDILSPNLLETIYILFIRPVLKGYNLDLSRCWFFDKKGFAPEIRNKL